MTTNVTPHVDRDARGFSLVELLVTMAITLVVMGATMTALGNAYRASDSATLITNLNAGLRVAMDLVVRDTLQVGQGLPTGRIITIPSGGTAVRLPGPPGTNFTLPVTTLFFTAVIPGPGRGPVVNGQATDMITTFAADSSFEGRALTAIDDNSMTVSLTTAQIRNGANISDGGANSADDIYPGDLIMITKSSLSAIVEVTSVAGQVINFAANDPLNLNQAAGVEGSVGDYRRTAPGLVLVANTQEGPTNGVLPSVATRIRMITYYIDAVTDPTRPRLVRRMNNNVCAGNPPPVGCNAAAFNNTLGTAVAFDVENLTFSYDLVDDGVNPTNVRLVAADLVPGGACGAIACDPQRIRKVNVLLAARARRPARVTRQVYRNSLFSQVSLRSLAFVDRYE